MNSLELILKEARKIVTPSEREIRNIDKIARVFLNKVNKEAKRYSEVVDVILAGSYARGTWLPGDVDIDIFLRFSPQVNEERFEQIGLDIGRRATRGFKSGRRYAQHPYTEARVNEARINIVPCYYVKPKEWKSAADRSPYHSELVMKKLDEEGKVQVRLLKKFMKSIGVYGAEIETEGFSGYATEVLIMKHGDFLTVLKNFADIKRIDEERLLMLPDPVDESRDLAKAISNENIAKLVLASRAFLREPSLDFFKGLRSNKRDSLAKDTFALIFKHKEMSEDILWGKLKRSLRHLSTHIEAIGFKLARYLAVSDGKRNSAFILLPIYTELSKLEERLGPSIELKNECENFIQKNRENAELIWVGGDARLHLLRVRKHTRLADFVLDAIRFDINKLGLSEDIAESIARTGKILSGSSLLKEANSKRWLRNGIDEIVSDTIGTRTH